MISKKILLIILIILVVLIIIALSIYFIIKSKKIPPTTTDINLNVIDNNQLSIKLSGVGNNLSYIITSLPDSRVGTLENIKSIPYELKSDTVIFTPKLIPCRETTARFSYKSKNSQGLLSNESIVSIKVERTIVSPTLKSGITLDVNIYGGQKSISVDLSQLVVDQYKDDFVYFVSKSESQNDWIKLDGYVFNITESLQKYVAGITVEKYKIFVVNPKLMCKCGDNTNPFINKCFSNCNNPTNLDKYGYYTDNTVCEDNSIPINYTTNNTGTIGEFYIKYDYIEPIVNSKNYEMTAKNILSINLQN